MKTLRFFPYVLIIFTLLALTTGMRPMVTEATIAVNTFSDEYNTGVSCSLREAVQAANTDIGFDNCTAGTGVDTILLPAGTYTLTIGDALEESNAEGDLDIIGNLTIRGLGAGAIINAGGIDRVLDILAAATVSLENITLTGGVAPNGKDGAADGGGIRNYANLTLTDVIVSSNHAGNGSGGDASGAIGGHGGGIYSSSGSLTISNSRITGNYAGNGENNKTNASGGNGGGIATDSGTVNILNTIVSGNAAGSGGDSNTSATGGEGGGCFCGGIITITGSTFSNNTAGSSTSTDGGDGGGIYANGELTLINSTLSGNSTGNSSTSSAGDGGGLTASNFIVIHYSTIYDNHTGVGVYGGRGGGLSSQAPEYLTLGATILAGNTSPGSINPDCFSPGSVTSEDYNLIGISIGCDFSGPVTNSFIGVTGYALSALADNGGPTWTHTLTGGNSAIDQIPAGTNGCGTSPYDIDQRGYSRPLDGDLNGTAACDIGAFEFEIYGVFLPMIRK